MWPGVNLTSTIDDTCLAVSDYIVENERQRESARGVTETAHDYAFDGTLSYTETQSQAETDHVLLPAGCAFRVLSVEVDEQNRQPPAPLPDSVSPFLCVCLLFTVSVCVF